MSVLAGVEPILDQLFDEIDLEREFLDFFRENHHHFAADANRELDDDDTGGGTSTIASHAFSQW